MHSVRKSPPLYPQYNELIFVHYEIYKNPINLIKYFTLSDLLF